MTKDEGNPNDQVRRSGGGFLKAVAFRISGFFRRSSFAICHSSALVGLLLTASLFAQPQPAPPPTTDPLMNLMITQPKIDTSSPVKASAAFDPPVVQAGEQAIYRVTFNALEESVDWPAEVPAPAELRPQPGAHGQILQMAGPSLIPLTSFNTRVRPTSPGQLTAPGFLVQVYGKPVTVPAAQLQVVAARPASSSPVARLILDARTTNVFVGQGIVAKVILPG